MKSGGEIKREEDKSRKEEVESAKEKKPEKRTCELEEEGRKTFKWII